MMHIGFVGLGHMGLPMAINLVKAGYQVTGFDLSSAAMEALVAAGGIKAQNLPEVAKSSEVLITMLQTGHQVNAVCLGEDGLFAHASGLHIDCSTIDVASSRIIQQEANRHGLMSVDAPVSGGVAGASGATLTFMVGGQEDAFVEAKPILESMGKKIIHTGPAGSGQAAKVCNNMILGVSMIVISEAFLLADKLNLSKEKLHEVVSSSSGQCWVMNQYVPVDGLLDNVPATNNYQPGFSAMMMLKDLRLSQQAALSEHLTTPMGERAQAIYETLVENGHGDLDFSAVINHLKDDQEVL